jgi:CDP-6-deoxy-D-xylo-4-hexulose-3-dehydrase
VFAVNLLGNPVDYTALRALCERHDLVFFEDNCESLGARFDGQYAGTFGLFGTHSTFFSHHISTMEGGIVVTDSTYLEQAMRSLRAHGWTRGLPVDNLIHPMSDDPFEDLFRFVLPGWNVRPLEMSGAIGRQQLKKLSGLVDGRRRNAATFGAMFEDNEVVDTQLETGESSWFGFAMILKPDFSGRRKELVAALNAAGVESRPVVTGNFARNPVIERLDADVPEDLTAADRIHFDGLFVGNHHFDISRELELVAEVVGSLAR